MKLNMSINEIHEALAIDCNSIWCNNRTTNCYAYSLGLDIPEDNIISSAYQVGTIGGHVFDTETYPLSFEEKLKLDLKALGIQYEECDCSEKSRYFLDKNDLINIEWIIALYKGRNDYHFLRKACDNSWWHKQGYSSYNPINYDYNFKKIYNPKECDFKDNYEYIKCLKLKCKV